MLGRRRRQAEMSGLGMSQARGCWKKSHFPTMSLAETECPCRAQLIHPYSMEGGDTLSPDFKYIKVPTLHEIISSKVKH